MSLQLDSVSTARRPAEGEGVKSPELLFAAFSGFPPGDRFGSAGREGHPPEGLGEDVQPTISVQARLGGAGGGGLGGGAVLPLWAAKPEGLRWADGSWPRSGSAFGCCARRGALGLAAPPEAPEPSRPRVAGDPIASAASPAEPPYASTVARMGSRSSSSKVRSPQAEGRPRRRSSQLDQTARQLL
jgi:hypothetical protein